MKTKKTLISLFFSVLLTSLSAQSITIKTNDGTESTDLLSSVESLIFEDDLLKVDYTSATEVSFQTDNIKSIYFTDVPDNLETINDNELTLSTNASRTELNIDGMDNSKNQIWIYSIDGILRLQTTIASESATINISSLNGGIYIIRINNQTQKFIK